jgi:tRNA (guanine37-N1)-methyltransferase
MGNDASGVDESFGDGLLEYPQYTRPTEFRGHAVPEVLRSGDHDRIARWRRAQALRRTLRRRPDLLARYELTASDEAALAEFPDGDDDDSGREHAGG